MNEGYQTPVCLPDVQSAYPYLCDECRAILNRVREVRDEDERREQERADAYHLARQREQEEFIERKVD